MIEYGVTLMAVFLAALSPLYYQTWKMNHQLGRLEGKIAVIHADVVENGGN